MVLTKLYVRVQSAFASDEGATAVEYGLLLIVIAAVAGIIVSIRGQITPVYQSVLTALSAIP